MQIDEMTTTWARRVSRGHLIVSGLALLLIGPTNHHPWVSVGCIATGLFLVALGMFSTTLPRTTGTEVAVAGAWGLLMVLGILGRSIGVFPPSLTGTRLVTTLLAAAASSMALMLSGLGRMRLAVGALALMTALIATGTMVSNDWQNGLGSDIYHAHRSAGAAIHQGENPYGSAVRFLDGNPFTIEERVFEGYPYPPVALAAFGISSIFTDPRMVSTVAWLLFLGWLGWRAGRRRTEMSGDLALSILLLAAISPLGTQVWFMAWTEPLTLVLFLGALLVWRRPWLAGILLGLALGSKQYLVFLAPLLLLHRDAGWVKRSSVAMVTVAATVIAPLAIDPSGFVRSVIGNTASIGFRPDTLSLSGPAATLGLEFVLPALVWVPLGLTVGYLLARGSRRKGDFASRAGMTLASVFLIGMAFPNYWFLGFGLIAIGAILAGEEIETVGSADPELASALVSRA